MIFSEHHRSPLFSVTNACASQPFSTFSVACQLTVKVLDQEPGIDADIDLRGSDVRTDQRERLSPFGYQLAEPARGYTQILGATFTGM